MLDQVEGRWEELVGRIQEKYGIARDDAERPEVERCLIAHRRSALCKRPMAFR